MKKINHKILMPVLFCLVILAVYFFNREKPEETPKKKLVFNERVENPNEEKQVEEKQTGNSNDINLLEAEEMVSLGVSKKIAQKIVDYRDLTGTISDMDELKKIKGIGIKNFEKIRKILVLEEENVGEKIKLNINNIGDEELSLLGFTKKELVSINKWKDKEGTIFSNIDLIKIIGEKRYDKIKNAISY